MRRGDCQSFGVWIERERERRKDRGKKIRKAAEAM